MIDVSGDSPIYCLARYLMENKYVEPTFKGITEWSDRQTDGQTANKAVSNTGVCETGVLFVLPPDSAAEGFMAREGIFMSW